MKTARRGPVSRGISPVAAAAAVIMAAVTVSAIALYPSFSGGSSPTTSLSNPPTNVTSYSSTTVTLPQTTSYPDSAPPATSPNTSWDAWGVANTTLGSPKVQAYIGSAYNYSFFISQTGENPVLVSNVISVVGTQKVQGNWTTGYIITYAHKVNINVTVQYSPPSHYQIIDFAIQNSSDSHGLLNFTSIEQEAIAGALTNTSVKSYLGSTQYYVAGAYLFPSTNATFGGDYLVTFDLQTGTNNLVVFVNPANWQVVATYQQSRIWATCYGDGLCYYSPWAASP